MNDLQQERTHGELQPPGSPKSFTKDCRCRLTEERQWVESLLRACGRQLHPLDLGRWLEKYRADCQALRHCGGRYCA